MYYDDRHHPPFHAYFGDYTALFTIDPPEPLTGEVSYHAQEHVRAAGRGHVFPTC